MTNFFRLHSNKHKFNCQHLFIDQICTNERTLITFADRGCPHTNQNNI